MQIDLRLSDAGALVAWTFGLLLLVGPIAAADEATVDAMLLQAIGLDIPPGVITPGDGQCVLTHDEQGTVVVGRLQVAVGDNRVVLLPDGQLVVRRADDSSQTERPFEPAAKDVIIQNLKSPAMRDFRSRETRHYVYLYNASEPFAELTSRILETMLRGVMTYAQVQGIDVHSPETPLVVVILRTAEQFREFGRMPEGVVAYYDVLTNRIVMYEESPLWQIKPDLAIRELLATIAHEGAHQILHNIGVQQRLSLWPMWLNEGLAEFFAPMTTDRNRKWKGAGQVNDTRMFELERWLRHPSASEADGQLVAQTVGAVRLTSAGYATAWALTHYVAKNHRDQFHAIVRHYSRLGPLQGDRHIVAPGVIPENVRVFKGHFGDDLADTERRLVQYLKHLPYQDPFAEWPHWVAMVSVPDGRRVRREAEVFHSEAQALDWCSEIANRSPEAQRAAIQTAVHSFPNRVQAEAFAGQWRQGG